MKRPEPEEPVPQDETKAPRVWGRDPNITTDKHECPPAEGDDGQVIEEPGYGHGV